MTLSEEFDQRRRAAEADYRRRIETAFARKIALARLPVAGRVTDCGRGHRLTVQPDPRRGFSELMDLADCAAADPKVSREAQEFLPAHVPGQGAGIQ